MYVLKLFETMQSYTVFRIAKFGSERESEAFVLNEYGYQSKLVIDGYIRRIQASLDAETKYICRVVPLSVFIMCFNFYYIKENEKPPPIKKRTKPIIIDPDDEDSWNDGWYW